MYSVIHCFFMYTYLILRLYKFFNRSSKKIKKIHRQLQTKVYNVAVLGIVLAGRGDTIALLVSLL